MWPLGGLAGVTVRAGRGGLADGARPTEGRSHECWGAVERGESHRRHRGFHGVHRHEQPAGALATVSGLWIMFFMGISQIPGDTLNAYTGMLAIASLGTNSKKFMSAQNRQAVRLIGILFIFVVGTILACLSSAHFHSSFENFIGVLLFFFVPWSAINLVDYYLVKHGRYDVQSFFKPDGIYGGFQWWACLFLRHSPRG